jgi:5'-nucleotidase
VSDEVFAKETEHIGLIIGGHTNTFLSEPVVHKIKIAMMLLLTMLHELA